MTSSQKPYRQLPNAEGCVQLVQLTDTHLCRNQGGTLLGMDTDHSLQAVIDLVKRERACIDGILATGDLSDQGAPESYQRLQSYFEQLPAEHYWLPGNHDDLEQMRLVVGDIRLASELRGGNWQVLMLNSQIPGEVGGELGDDQLNLLDEQLAEASKAELHTLICLHHQPVPIGCAWLDGQMTSDADRFFQIVDRFAGVRGILWGHVHQEVQRQRGQVLLMASPSTCVQFAPGQTDFKADNLAPGYRWLDLMADGQVKTGVSRVTDRQFHVDLDTTGYL
ncbi:MAG: 3',5'-cyclic-AMP phosphodiesterase [Halioglobus sp.]